MILGFAHPAIVVRDLDTATQFYCDAFGFSIFSSDTESWENKPAIDAAIGLANSSAKGRMLSGHNCFLELFCFEKPTSHAVDPRDNQPCDYGLRHLCFYVDDVEVEYQRLLGLGAQRLGTPQKKQGITAVYLRDPEGNIIELAEFPDEREDLRKLPGLSRLQEFSGHVQS